MNERTARARLRQLYDCLLGQYGPQGWWPTTPLNGDEPRYYPEGRDGALRPEEQWEIAVGAVLTQNTAWRNAEQALIRLAAGGVRHPAALLALKCADVAELVRPSGYYNQKTRRLRGLAGHIAATHGGCVERWLGRPPDLLRSELLELKGIGPETADCILLYAAGYPYFVIDAFTRRICSRLGLIDEVIKYAELQDLFTRSLPRDTAVYNEYHALLVRHAVESCRVRPRCAGCCLRPSCPLGRQQAEIQ